MKLKVIVAGRSGTFQVAEFDDEEVVVGRINGCDIVLPSDTVSKCHAKLVTKDGAVTVVDLHSVSGTYVNGQRVAEPRLLKDGDTVGVESFILEVRFAPALPPEEPPHPWLTENILAVEVTGPEGTQLVLVDGTRATIGRDLVSDVVLDHGSVPDSFGSFFVQKAAVAVVVDAAVRWLDADDTVEVGVFTLRARYGPRHVVAKAAPSPAAAPIDELGLMRFAAANHCNAGVVPEDRIVPTVVRTWQQGAYACSEWSTGPRDEYRRKNFLVALAGGCAATVTATALASLELLPQDAWCALFPRTTPPGPGWEDDITCERTPHPTMKDPFDDYVLESVGRLGPVVLLNHSWSDCFGPGGALRGWVHNRMHCPGLALITTALANGAPSLEEMVRWVRVLGGDLASPVDTEDALVELIDHGLDANVCARWHAPRMDGVAMQCVCHDKERRRLVQLSHSANTGLRQVVLGDAPMPPMDMGCE